MAGALLRSRARAILRGDRAIRENANAADRGTVLGKRMRRDNRGYRNARKTDRGRCPVRTPDWYICRSRTKRIRECN
jgi:hypothetical protein